jgi:hypothetical protein
VITFPRSLFTGLYGIETKAGNGTQSPLQKQFEADAKDRGEMYVLAYSIDDLAAAGL